MIKIKLRDIYFSYHASMDEISRVRLKNLIALDLRAKQLNDLVGNSLTYWYDMLKGNKGFGERAARKLEDKLHLAPGSLDIPDSCKPFDPSAPPPPPMIQGQALAPDTVLLAKWFEKLPEDSLERFQASAAIMQVIIGYLPGGIHHLPKTGDDLTPTPPPTASAVAKTRPA